MERPAASRRARPRDVVIVVLLIVGLVSSLVLVVTGGDEAAVDGTTTTVSDAELPIEDVSMQDVALASGLAFPSDAGDFLTSRVGEQQLDVTFTMSADVEAAFVEQSGLPAPTPGRRTVLHSSPLWKLNPGAEDADDDGTASSTTLDPERIRGTTDTYDGIDRAVELYDEAPGVVRARIVLTSAG